MIRERTVCALRRKEAGYLIVVLIVAFVLRAGFGLTRTGLTASVDERHWDGLGRAFATLGILNPDTGTYRPPLYGLLLAGIYRTCGHSLAAVRLIQAGIDTATCALLYLLGCRLGGHRMGLVSAAIGAVYPLFIFFTGVLMVETLLVFLSTASIWLFLHFWDRPAIVRGVLFGFVVGLSALCKPVLLPWVPLVLWVWWRRASLGRAEKFMRTVAVIGAIGLTVFPWTLRNKAVSGHWVPISSNTGINLMIGSMPGSCGIYDDAVDYLAVYRTLTGTSDFVAGDRKMMHIVWQWVLDDPTRFLVLSLRKLAWFWSPWVPGESAGRNLVALCSSGPLLILGVWGTIRLRRSPEGSAMGLLMVSLSVVHIIFFAHTRFRLPIDALLCVTTAWLICGASQRWSARHGS